MNSNGWKSPAPSKAGFPSLPSAFTFDDCFCPAALTGSTSLPGNAATAVRIQVSGKDAEGWAGHFGVAWRGLSLSITAAAASHDAVCCNGITCSCPATASAVVPPTETYCPDGGIRSAPLTSLPIATNFSTVSGAAVVTADFEMFHCNDIPYPSCLLQGSGHFFYVASRCVGRRPWVNIGLTALQPARCFSSCGATKVTANGAMEDATMQCEPSTSVPFDGGSSLHVCGTSLEQGACLALPLFATAISISEQETFTMSIAARGCQGLLLEPFIEVLGQEASSSHEVVAEKGFDNGWTQWTWHCEVSVPPQPATSPSPTPSCIQRIGLRLFHVKAKAATEVLPSTSLKKDIDLHLGFFRFDRATLPVTQVMTPGNPVQAAIVGKPAASVPFYRGMGTAKAVIWWSASTDSGACKLRLSPNAKTSTTLTFHVERCSHQRQCWDVYVDDVWFERVFLPCCIYCLPESLPYEI